MRSVVVDDYKETKIVFCFSLTKFLYACRSLTSLSLSQVRTYVREYIGDNEKAKSFAKEFLERQQSSEWKHVPKKSSPPKHSVSSGVVARGGVTEQRSEPESSGGKKNKKKKQRMQKVDPSILGFSVNAAAERVNMGEIQSIEDS